MRFVNGVCEVGSNVMTQDPRRGENSSPFSAAFSVKSYTEELLEHIVTIRAKSDCTKKDNSDHKSINHLHGSGARVKIRLEASIPLL